MTLIDQYNRVHTYLRISVTDRCNYRCVYCMPKEGLRWEPKENILQYEEIAYLAHLFCKLGIKQIRITGGEPTLRSDICSLIEALAKTNGLEDLSMTTNGHLLSTLAPSLRKAGLKRCNISIDSLQEDRFHRITRGGSLQRVLHGIDTAIANDIAPIKCNVVLLKGQNDDEIMDFIHYCAARPHVLKVRFIEYMPFEARWHQCVSNQTVLDRISEHYSISEHNSKVGSGPAKEYVIPELGVHVGFISPLSNKFCQGCNRLRLMADGNLRTCLSKEKHPSLRDVIRSPHSEDELLQHIRNIVWNKVEAHTCSEEEGKPFEGVMTRIGG